MRRSAPYLRLCLLFVLGCLVLALPPRVWGQDDINDVHITPRRQQEKKPVKIPRDGSGETIKVDVPLVLVPGTVIDPQSNTAYSGLVKENFELFDNKKKQKIQTVTNDNSPIVMGFIFDMSGSMTTKADQARQSVAAFCDQANRDDEFFFVDFSDVPEVSPQQGGGFYTSCDELLAHMTFLAPKGMTALLDAIYLGVKKLDEVVVPKSRDGRLPNGLLARRKALLIVSDGGDNHSRYTEGEVKSLIEESDVLIYSIGIFDPRIFMDRNAPPEERRGPELLAEISEATGGRMLPLTDSSDLGAITYEISRELSSQYILSYRPSNREHKGKWHNIKVRLHLPRGLPSLHPYFRRGYYEPDDR